MPRRILLLITDLEIGGTPTVVRELAIRLNDPPEVLVEVACLKGWGPVADQLREVGVQVTAFGATRPWQLARVRGALRLLLSERGFDTVVSFLVHANTVAALAVKPPVRLVQSIQTTQRWPLWHWGLQRLVQRRAMTLLAPSRAIVEAADRYCGIPPERFTVIPNAIDPDDFPRARPYQGGTLHVGFLGRIDPVKRPELALHAAELVRDLPTRFHLFGSSPREAKIRRFFERDDPEGKTKVYHGAAARPQDALSQIHLLLMPSVGEGFGLVVIEAMASGVLVIASEAGALPEIIRDGTNGLLVPHQWGRETKGFAEAIRKLHADPSLRERLIANGLATVRERYTWDVALPQYRRLLRLDQS